MKKENLIFVEEAMKYPKIIKMVTEASERIWHKVPDLTSFEYVCYRNIGQAFLTKEGIRTKVGIASRIINRAEAWYIKYRGCESIQSLESLADFDEEGAIEPFEILDEMAFVETKVIKEEIYAENAALLAKGDVRKKAILKAWTIGYLNARELSGVLANTFGGKAESHRKSIQRFEIECKKLLNVA